MEIDRFLEATKGLAKKKARKEEVERLRKVFERFCLLNRSYLDKESIEKLETPISMAETIVSTVRYLDSEISRLRNKRMKLPFENVQLGEMQRVQKKNEMLLKKYLEGFSR